MLPRFRYTKNTADTDGPAHAGSTGPSRPYIPRALLPAARPHIRYAFEPDPVSEGWVTDPGQSSFTQFESVLKK